MNEELIQMLEILAAVFFLFVVCLNALALAAIFFRHKKWIVLARRLV